MRGALDLKVNDCPVCDVMKNKRPKKPTDSYRRKEAVEALGESYL